MVVSKMTIRLRNKEKIFTFYFGWLNYTERFLICVYTFFKIVETLGKDTGLIPTLRITVKTWLKIP